MNVQIKIMNKEDLKDIKDFSDFDDFWTLEILKGDIEEEKSIYFKAMEENEIVGILGIKKICDIVEIMNIAVRKDKRKRGIGTDLLIYLKEYINKLDEIKAIELEVNKNNTMAIELYKKCGFKSVGIRPKYYNGRDDAILMNFDK